MDSELKYENANLRFENAKLKFETLYNERPSTIRSVAFHGGLRILYLVAGLIGFVGSSIYLGYMILLMATKEEVINFLQKQYHVAANSAEFMANTLLPTQLALSIVLLSLSICLLIMARLCRKIVKRNMYIMDLETTWMDLKK